MRGDEPPAPGSSPPNGAIFLGKYISYMLLDPSEAGWGHYFDFFLQMRARFPGKRRKDL